MLRMQQSAEKTNSLKPHEIAQGIVSSCEFLNGADNSDNRHISISQICENNFVQNNQCDLGLIEEVFIEIKKLSDKAGDNAVERSATKKTSIYSAATDAVLDWSKSYGNKTHDSVKKFKFDVSFNGYETNQINDAKEIKHPTKGSSYTKKIIIGGLILTLGAGFIGPNFDKLKGFSLKKISRPNPMELLSAKKDTSGLENDGRGKVLNIPKNLTDNRVVTNLDEGAMLYDQLNNEYIFWGIGTKNQGGKKQRPITTLQMALEKNLVPLPKDFDIAYVDGTKNLDHKKNAIRFARLMTNDEKQGILIYKTNNQGTE